MENIVTLFSRPVHLFRSYRPGYLRTDLLAGLTVAIILLPQAIAYASIAELPAQTGLYTAIIAAIVGGLWGSSNHLQTGPTNAISLLVLTTLLTFAQPGSPEFLVGASLMAVMVGVFRLALGVARLGVLVNFVSDAVIIGFTTGAGILIAFNQLRHLLRLDISNTPSLVDTVKAISVNLGETHLPSLLLGLGVILVMIVLLRFAPQLPEALIALVGASILVALLHLNQAGVKVIGELPRSLPPLSNLPIFNLDMLADLSAGALAVGSIGLVEAISTARAVSSMSGQRIDSNQEFVGQGLAAIASGLFSGYPPSGSPSRSMVDFRSRAETSLSSVFSGLFVLIGMLALAPAAAYLPRTALAGVLIVTAARMIDRAEIARIWRGARGDAYILIFTLFSTLLLPLHLAVLGGILASFAFYIMRTSVPRVVTVLPDESFRHFTHQPEKPQCPQLAVIDILGDLYFGAVNHVEKAIRDHLNQHPEQRFLLLRMQSSHQCDISGIHGLEAIHRLVHERGGEIFFTRVRQPVLSRMKATGFHHKVGPDHFLPEDQAISYLFNKVIDPAICIYECDVRAFMECQNLPKRVLTGGAPAYTMIPSGEVPSISARELWQAMHDENPPKVVDVREPREFHRGHIPEAELKPLPELLAKTPELPAAGMVVFVCRGGRRSTRAAYLYREKGYAQARVLEGGMLAWEAAALLEAVENNGNDEQS